MSHMESTYLASGFHADGDDDTWLYGNDGVDAPSVKTSSDSGATTSSSSSSSSKPATTTTTTSAAAAAAAASTTNLDDYGQPDDTFHDEDANTNTFSAAAEAKNPAAPPTDESKPDSGEAAQPGLFLSDEEAAFNYDDQVDSGTPLQDNGGDAENTDGVVDYKRTDSMAEESEPTPTNDDNGEPKNDADGEEEDEDEDDDDDDDDGFKVNIVLDNIVTKPFSAQPLAAGAAGTFGRQQSKPGATGPGGAAAATGAATAAKPAAVKGVDLEAPGLINDLPTYEFNIDGISEEEKPWRKPGADITDFFNYGFTEETWVAYCVKQKRQRAENANLKSTVMMLNQQNSAGYNAANGSCSSLNGSSGGPLQPIQVNNKMNPSGQYQPRPPFYRPPPPQTNQRPPFGMPPMFNEQPGDMSHQPNFVQPPPIVDLTAPPPGWATGPPPSIPPPILGQQQAQQPGAAGMMSRLPPQQRMMTPNSQPIAGAGFHTAPPAQFSNPPGSFQYPPPMMAGTAGVVSTPQVNIPPPNAGGGGGGFGFNQPPPTMQFSRTGINQAPGQIPLLTHPPPTAGATWEKPPTIDQQQSQFFDPSSLKSPTKSHSQPHRNSRSPTPGVQSPSHTSNRSPSSQHQPSESTSMHRYQSSSKLDADGKPSSGDSSYKPSRSGGRSDYDRDHRDRDRDRRSPSSPRHRHRHYERYERRDHRDRDRSRSRSRDRDRSRSREDRYSKRSRKKSEEDDYYRSKQSSSSSSASLSKRPKKSSRSDRDGSGERVVSEPAAKTSQPPPSAN